MAHDKRRHGTAWWLCIGAALLAANARAQPFVRVQAGTQIVLHGMHGERGLDLRGALLDDLGSPLAAKSLEVTIAAADDGETLHFASRSAGDGRFRVIAPLDAGVYRVRVRFTGDGYHAASDAERELDLTRADVRLAFIEPRSLRLDLDADAHDVVVRATSAQGGGSLDVELRDERGVSLARGRTDADGVFRASLAAKALGAPGSGRLIATSEPDALRAAAQVEIVVLRWRATRLRLQAHADAGGERLVIAGSLRDSRSGLADKAVGLFEGERHLATLLTDGSGNFAADLPLRSGAPEASVQARFDSDASWLGSSRSQVVTLALTPSAPLSPLWLLAPLCASAALVWLLLRRPAAERAVAPRPAAGVGIHTPRGRGRGRAGHRRIAGAVQDSRSEHPVRDAVLELRAPDGESIELHAGADGVFQSPELRDGDWTLTILAPGYAMLASTLTIPHRGEWEEVRVQLQSLRSAAVAAYKPAALRVLPNVELWQRWTARETLQNAQKNGRATEAFVRLTERVEQAAYARTPPSLDELADIERVAAEALARFPAPSQPAGSGSLRATIPHRR